MKKTSLIVGASLLAVATVEAYLEIRRVSKEEHAKRIAIAQNTERHLDAIKRASLKMEQKLKDPNYRVRGVQQVFDDLEFEIIAAHYE